MIKSCLGVHNSTHNDLVLIESGMPTLNSMILLCTFNFFIKFQKTYMIILLQRQSGTLISTGNMYIQHNWKLTASLGISIEIKLQTLNLMLQDNHKYMIYSQFNLNVDLPDLSTHHASKLARLKLSSHSLLTEKGCWGHIVRQKRLMNVI